MPTAKKIKKVAPVTGEHEEEEVEGGHDDAPSKNKKPIEIDDHEPIIGGEEKVEEDPLIAPSEDDELVGEELSLDGEELNPFGDRWEE